MATPSPTDFQMNNRPRNPQTLGQFIRMKRVPGRGKKPSLGIKKLINRFENRVISGEQVQGSILASPSASSNPEDDSDCESWGSDFDDDENERDNSWEPQDEEIENSINDMLEAAMERNKNLQNSTVGGNEAAQGLPSRSNIHLPAEPLAISEEPDAPPLPPRNPAGMSSASPVNSRGIMPSASNSVPSRGTSENNVKPLSRSIPKPPAVAQTKSPTQVIKPSVSRFATSGIFNVARIAPEGSTRSQLPRETTSQQASPTFPPDVAISNNSATSSRLTVPSSVITTSGRTPPVLRGGVNKSPNTGASNLTNNLQVPNAQRGRFPQPQLAEVSNQPNEPNEMSVPPPLPSRPPPVGRPLNNPPSKNRPVHSVAASASRARNEAAADQEITQFTQVKIRHPVSPLTNSVAKLHITKDTSSSLTNLAEHTLQTSSFPESSKPKSSTGEHLLARNIVVKLPEKPDSKRKSLSLGVPKIIKEIDAAILKQAMSKKRNKSASFGEVEPSSEKTRWCVSSENSAKAEDASSPSDEYLNPKEMSIEGPRFQPDRPTLPRRLKHARSLSLHNLVDTLRKDSLKNKITADDQKGVKLCLQPSQGIKDQGLEFPVVDDDVFQQPWYHPVTWTQAQFKLTTMAQDGAFLVRPSSKVSQGVPFTISVFFRGRIINCHITSTPEKKYVLGKMKPNQKTFDTITELIRYHQSTPAELKISESEPVSKVCLLITPPRDPDKIYADV